MGGIAFACSYNAYIVFKYSFHPMFHYQSKPQPLKGDRCYGRTSKEGVKIEEQKREEILPFASPVSEWITFFLFWGSPCNPQGCLDLEVTWHGSRRSQGGMGEGIPFF
jgi:hypothetical protein